MVENDENQKADDDPCSASEMIISHRYPESTIS